MEIKAFQYLFTVPENVEGSTCYPVPSSLSYFEVQEPSKNGYYIIKTHERGEAEQNDPESFSPYYQVVFRITDPSPFKKEELSLSLFRSSFRGDETLRKNDLYYNEELDFWYQRTKCKKNNKTGRWEVDDSKYKVESITVSGVFKVSVLRNNILLTEPQFEKPWFYILPDPITKEQYCNMLSDLLDLNEQLIRNDKSSVGVGRKQISSTDSLAEEIQKTKELKDAISSAMSLPAELLEKKYIKKDINKVKRFDTRVIQDSIKHGMTGKISAIQDIENHDTYENRVIKYVLKRIDCRLQEQKKKSIPTSSEIEKRTNEYLDNQRKLFNCETEPKDRNINLNTDANLLEQLKKTNEFTKARDKSQKYNTLIDERIALTKLLKNKWFDKVTELKELPELHPTPKFTSNPYYSVIYRIIKDFYFEKPFLSADFDINAFGVRDTQQVYEFWVLHKMLCRLDELGFEFRKEELNYHFKNFFKSRNQSEFKILMTRGTGERKIKIEFGYNVRFEPSPGATKGSRTPDFYIKVIKGNKNDWYFFDAKYKPFQRYADNKHRGYEDEIFQTSVSKYIRDIGNIFEMNPNYGSKATDICGSYIIMAYDELDDYSRTPWSQYSEYYRRQPRTQPEDYDYHKEPFAINDRLYGAHDSIAKRTANDQSFNISSLSFLKEKNMEEQYLPKHRYGAVVLYPGYDTELNILYKLIFEYLEKYSSKEYAKKLYCWNCNYSDIEGERKWTSGDKAKYYATCPNCGDSRVITHCEGGEHLIIKHGEGNYHYRDNKKNSPWAFVCPTCKRTL